MLMGLGAMAQSTYTMITSQSSLNAGDKVLLVGFNDDGQAYVMSYQKSNNRHAVAVDVNGDVIVTSVATDPSSQTEPFELTVGGGTGAWTFFDELNNGYLYAPGGGNYLKTQSTNDNKGQWTLSNDGDGFVPVSNGDAEQNIMRYNPNTQNNSPLFGCYKPSSSINGLVYIFKAGGAPVINPEPSNYPTDVTALVDGVDVYVIWEDATGAQLPSKYLVLASTGNITVPVDGVPVPDSDLAKNVAYGVNMAVFSGLQPFTTYHFAIFPYTNSGANIDYKTDGNYPTAEVTTEQTYFFVQEDFDDGLGVFTAYDMYGDQSWHQATYQGTTYANMNGYAGGASNQNEDWLISPLVHCDFEDVWMEFSTAMKFDGNPLEVLISVDYDGQSEPTEATWFNITDVFDFSTGNYEWVESGNVELWGLLHQNGVSGHPDFHVAFVYTSTTSAASSWEIDYVYIRSEGTVSVDDYSQAEFSVYPNPASDMVSFNLERDAQVSVFDVTGRMVGTMNMAAGQGQYRVANFENGVYFLSIRYADGKQEVARFVKF